MYTNKQYASIHLTRFCDGNVAAALRGKKREFPNQQGPEWQVFTSAHEKFIGHRKIPRYKDWHPI
jgi:hypothetical protein